MKTAMRRDTMSLIQYVYIIVIGLFCLPSLYAQDTVYAANPQDAQYLRYYTVSNTFDSCIVLYEAGEFRLSTSGTYSRIYLDTLLKSGDDLTNSGTTGAQTTLSSVLRTVPFYIDAFSDTISMFRGLSLRKYSILTSGETSSWRVNDRTEFVIQLVRSSDNVVLVTLDSVGIDSTTSLSTNWPTYFGTDTSTWCTKIFIPFTARAVNAYLRIEPIRYGTTPAGLNAWCRRSRASLSSYYNCTPGNMNPGFNAVRDARFFSRLISYYDDYYVHNCALPQFMPSLPEDQADSIRRRYFTVYCTDSGVTSYKTIPCESPKAPVRKSERDSTAEALIRATSYRAGELAIYYQLNKYSSAEIVVYDNRGRIL